MSIFAFDDISLIYLIYKNLYPKRCF